MVWSVIQNFRQAAKFRGGWYNLYLHMYTNSDYPFKFGSYMGHDAAGNRYYENRVDYPFGQHRWVEPGDIHNFDSSSVPPEWQGWMNSMNDCRPSTEDEYFESSKSLIKKIESKSDAPAENHLGHQEKLFNFHHMHNQSQVRSRGYNIGNAIVGLPPGAPDAYYTQPGSPYHPDFIRKPEMIGDLDEAEGGGRPYKSDKWAERLRTKEEKDAIAAAKKAEDELMLGNVRKQIMMRQAAARGRGGTIARR
eukprot:CAMPEP_0194145766 /NCGR_PEP_ID=MMETSP0152-20130528/18819_1 /TAXON_ID=1049557 /ORGANISM="Thalassiothrix antarctica, Strain L6-D1" /LENGTH=248 /DNA_ID=CAMNT_0038846101 /DNA_START=146 /DNA_END=892 /DNA_ORIENTATION=-